MQLGEEEVRERVGGCAGVAIIAPELVDFLQRSSDLARIAQALFSAGRGHVPQMLGRHMYSTLGMMRLSAPTLLLRTLLTQQSCPILDYCPRKADQIQSLGGCLRKPTSSQARLFR
jgi:hypothetical protein